MRVREPDRPLTYCLLVGSTAAAISMLVTAADPPSLSQQLGSVYSILWSIILLAGSLSALIGMHQKSIITGAIFEIPGMYAVALCYVSYAFSVVLTNGWYKSQVSAPIILAVGIGCMVRAHQLSRAWRIAVSRYEE